MEYKIIGMYKFTQNDPQKALTHEENRKFNNPTNNSLDFFYDHIFLRKFIRIFSLAVFPKKKPIKLMVEYILTSSNTQIEPYFTCFLSEG